MQNYSVNQKVSYQQCASVYTGVIVRVKENSLIIIDSEAGMTLWNAGYAVGAEVSFEQVIN